MKTAEFEEKEYEHPLLSQLARGNGLFWPPGQVLEHYLGFDRGLLLTANYLWDLHGIRIPFPGVIPFLEYWPFLPAFRNRRDRLPSFRLNCFVQVKRCEVGSRLPRTLRRLGSVRPFYRFTIDQEQQLGLNAAASALTSRALFTYAAPVFATARRLFFLQQTGELVENSTFPDVRTLDGHSSWYYNCPGATGVVNQDFEFAELATLASRVDELVRQQARAEDRTPSENLSALSGALRRSFTDWAESETAARAAYLAEDWREVDRFADRTELPGAARSFLEIFAFTRRYGLEWLVVDERAI